MQTITFYAYKGGTGRSLMLANAAKYLGRLGQRVFCLDLDLEAPGLHHKLQLDSREPSREVTKGVVDWFTYFSNTGKVAESLREYTVLIRGNEDREGSITLMPAGAVLSRDYWKQLSKIDWHKLFFSDKPTGLPLFLELKARIQKEFSPDFLLIDARTGITEIGGVATTMLPDHVVCLLLNNRENLEGAREVLRGIRSTPRLPGQTPVDLLPVLSRIPDMRLRRAGREDRLIEDVRAFINEADDSGLSLDVSEVLVLHSEDALQIDEAIRIGGPRSVDQSTLLRDYLRLFSRLIPNEAVAPHIHKLVNSALSHMLDSPDETQGELEELAAYCPHRDAFLALLKYYRLRNVGSDKTLLAASRYWEFSGDSQNEILWSTVREHFKFEKKDSTSPHGSSPVAPEFLEAVWQSAGSDDIDVAMNLAELYISRARSDKALEVIKRLLEHNRDDERAIVASINLVTNKEQWDFASSLLDRYQSRLGGQAAFQTAWARVAVKRSDPTRARMLLESKEFLPAQMQASEPELYVHLLRLISDRKEELHAALLNMLDRALTDRQLTSKLYETHQLFMQLGKRNLFEDRVREVLPPSISKRILQPLGFDRE
jgi:CobQ/CobB/MinD/ParA nucleotide binding domain